MSEERNLLMLYDPTRITEKVMLVPQDIVYILQYFDGAHSLLDIRAEYMRKFGQFLYEDRLRKLIEDLDAHLLLDNERFAEYLARQRALYRDAPFRAALLAGESYEADPDRLRAELDGYFTHDNGPGRPTDADTTKKIGAAVVPHIDMRSGGPCYAHAYRALAEAAPVDLFIILGTCHSAMQEYFSATKKDFHTPWGLLSTDAEFIDGLHHQWQGGLFRDELMHKVEHTIEFQVIFLRYLFGENCRIAPILCSFSPDEVDNDESGKLRSFCETLASSIEAFSGRVCVIASVDFSHIGPRYGDAQMPDANLLSLVRSNDLTLLDLIMHNDSAAFTRLLRDQQNKYRICGFAPIYTLLSSIGAENGRVLQYDKAVVDNAGSVVTFASAIVSTS